MVEETVMDIVEMTRAHDATYKFVCELGTFKLKALSRFKFDEIAKEKLMEDPNWVFLIKELDYYNEVLAHPKGKLKADEAARMAELTRATDEWGLWFQIECFVEPKLTHPDQLEAMSSEMDPEEWEQLAMMLMVLSNPKKASERERALAKISVKYNLPMSDGLTADNITVQQTALLDEIIEDEEKQIYDELEALKLGNSG